MEKYKKRLLVGKELEEFTERINEMALGIKEAMDKERLGHVDPRAADYYPPTEEERMREAKEKALVVEEEK